MEGTISPKTSQQRKEVYDRYGKLTARNNEITELGERFRLLDAQYTNDIKRLVAIEESGQFFSSCANPWLAHCAAHSRRAKITTPHATAMWPLSPSGLPLRLRRSGLLQSELQVDRDDTVKRTGRSHYREEDRRRRMARIPETDRICSVGAGHLPKPAPNTRALIEKAFQRSGKPIVIYKRVQGLKRRAWTNQLLRHHRRKLGRERRRIRSQPIHPQICTCETFSKPSSKFCEWHFPGATDVYFLDEGKARCSDRGQTAR